MILPVSPAPLTTRQSHFQVSQKWGSVHRGASQLVSEIYRFLGSVGPYPMSFTGNGSQKRFARRLQDLVRHLPRVGVQEEDFMDGEAEDDGFPEDNEALEAHANQYLYGAQPRGRLRRMAGDCIEELEDEDVEGRDGLALE